MSTDEISRGISSHPYSVNAIDKLPESLNKLLRNGFLADQEIEGIFVVPPGTFTYKNNWHHTPLQALIFSHPGVIHLTAPSQKDRSGNVTWMSAEDIFMIKLNIRLLYGGLELYGVCNKQTTKIDVEYNTVRHDLLSPLLRNLIKKTWFGNPINFASLPQDAAFSDFVNISYSFYNGLVFEAIQKGERVLGYVFQPEIREPWLRIFHKRIFPQTVVAFTDQQLILLQQDLDFDEHHEWLFTFIPIHRIASIKLIPYKTWQKAFIHFPAEYNQTPIELILDSVRSGKMQKIWTMISAS